MKRPFCKRLLAAAVGLAFSTLLVAMALARLGTPLNVYTWIVILLAAASGLSLMIGNKWRRRISFFCSLLLCFYLVFPFQCQVIPVFQVWALFDDVGGRWGTQITPGLRFGRAGSNTALLEQQLGRLEPQWEYARPYSPYIRDGNERVRTRGLIFSDDLPEILDMLPERTARRTLLRSLTDPENRMRVHQGLLLTCLYVLDYPEGMDSESWWKQHHPLLEAEYDPFVAASLTQGWLDNVEQVFPAGVMPSEISSQCRAVRYQERGQWGGHYDFGDATLSFFNGRREPDPEALERGNQVVWWPKRQRQVSEASPE